MLQAQKLEITQSQADSLTAGLRANPLLYADTQGIPYGRYSTIRPGNTQYDINVTHPLDLSHKRRARLDVANRAIYVVQAQFQDAVRLKIAELYTRFVEVQKAQLIVHASQKNLEWISRYAEEAESDRSVNAPHLRILRARAQRELKTAREDHSDKTDILAALLELDPDKPQQVDVRGPLYFSGDVILPPDGELLQVALQVRPDLTAQRLGLQLAESNLRLMRANRYEDVYLLYQPYTFVSNVEVAPKSVHAWALGVTVPMPVYNRNQGNIGHAMINVTQTQILVADAERRVRREVKKALDDYRSSLTYVRDLDRDVLPLVKDRLEKLEGELMGPGGQPKSAPGNYHAIYEAMKDQNDVAMDYINALVTLRQSILTVNAAIGLRILP